MNPDKTSRDEIEVKLTALLLGELPDDEAKLLRWTISQDAALQKLHDELESTIVLIREAEKNPAAASGEKIVPLKLSDNRREKLLAHFKTPRPQESFWIKRLEIPSLVTVLALVAVMAVLAAMLLPSLAAAKKKAQRVTMLSGKAVQDSREQTWGVDNLAANAATPATVTVAPEPVLAPHMAIILPPTESPAQIAAITGSLADSEKAGAYPRGTSDWNIQNNSGAAAATPPADSFGVQTSAGDQTVTFGGQIRGVVNSFNAANTARFGGASGGGGGGAGGTPATDSSSLAWYGSGANRSSTANGPANLGEELRRQKIPAGTAGASYDFALSDGGVATSQKNLPDIALNTIAGESSVDRKLKLENSDQLLAKGLQERDGDALIAGNKFYRTPTRGRADINGSFDAAVPSAAPAKPGSSTDTPLFAAAEFSKRTEESKLMDKSGSSTLDLYSEKEVAAKTALPSLQMQRLPQSGGGTLALNGKNSFSGGTTVGAGNLALGVTKDSFETGLAKNDAAALRYLTTTNAVVARKFGEAQKQAKLIEEDKLLLHTSIPAPIPQPEIQARENNFSTFSLNVSDVSFKLAAASLEQGQMPDAASIRSEEFINAFDYRDPEAAAGQPLAFASERARYPFAHNRDLLRFSVKTAAAGRPAGRALNLVLLLDNSGSMERADRVAIIREALHVLATQLQPQDTVSVVTFARTARLRLDGVSGKDAGAELEKIGSLTPQGGTNLEEAMRLAYETARRHYLANGMNRVVLLTDGAANLGNVDATVLKEKVEAQRKQGIALDCFGIGWEGFNDDTLEQLSRNGDGRYAFLNSPEDASKEFAAKLAGALQVAASDVKVQVEFNPQRVISYRQIGYAKHQLTKEQFRDNTVDAAEIAAQEAGNALYTIETKPDGSGPVATVRVRYKVPGTTDYRERSWDVAYTGSAVSLEQSSAAMRLAATASAFSEWLASSPFAQEVSPDDLLKGLSGVPQIYGADERPKKLEWMIRQAKSLSGK
jgi:autotransporter-associated beta strand protein